MASQRYTVAWLCGLALLLSGCQPGALSDANELSPTAESVGASTQSPTDAPTATVRATEPAVDSAGSADIPTPARLSYTVVNELPHDTSAFTQGLVYIDGLFIEGTGLRGQSSLRKVDPQSGEVLAGIRYPDQYFAEGVAVMGNRIFQLTWQSNIGFIFDKDTLESIGEFSYPTEGWGLTHDGERLIMSDGTSTIYFLNADTQAIEDQITVRDDQGPIVRLNELEFIDGAIYANIWQTEQIAIIEPDTGVITAYIDLAGLPDREARASLMQSYGLDDEAALDGFLQTNATLNGIAYDAAGDRLFVTGKLWPEIYEIDLVDE